MRSFEAMGLLEMIFEHQSGDSKQVAFKFSIDAYKTLVVDTPQNAVDDDDLGNKDSEFMANGNEISLPLTAGHETHTTGVCISVDLPEEQDVSLSDNDPIPHTEDDTAHLAEPCPSPNKSRSAENATSEPKAARSSERKSSPQIEKTSDRLSSVEELSRKKRRTDPETVNSAAEPRRSGRRKDAGKYVDTSHLPAVLQNWNGKHAVKCSDGKKRDWAREFEPWMRNEVKAGNASKEEYLSALKDTELSQYFPSTVDWA